MPIYSRIHEDILLLLFSCLLMNIKVFFTWHFLTLDWVQLHWIALDCNRCFRKKKKILILVIHSVVTQEVPSMLLLLSWLRTMQWFCVPLSKWGQLPLSSEFKIPHPSYKGVLQHALSSSFRHIFYYKSQIAHSFLCNWLWPFPT